MALNERLPPRKYRPYPTESYQPLPPPIDYEHEIEMEEDEGGGKTTVITDAVKRLDPLQIFPKVIYPNLNIVDKTLVDGLQYVTEDKDVHKGLMEVGSTLASAGFAIAAQILTAYLVGSGVRALGG